MEFATKSKDLVDKVKAMWSSLSSWREQKPFFRRALPPSPPLPEVGKVGGGAMSKDLVEVEASNFRPNTIGTDSTRGRTLSGVRVNLKQTSHRNRFKCNPISSTSKDCKSCTESNCWHGCSPNFSKLFTSRKAARFYKQLEVANKRLLGTWSGTGLPHRIHVQATSSKETTFTCLPSRTDKSHPSRAQRALPKRGNHGVDHSPNRRLLLKPISIAQIKDGSQRSIINLKALNQFIQA